MPSYRGVAPLFFARRLGEILPQAKVRVEWQPCPNQRFSGLLRQICGPCRVGLTLLAAPGVHRILCWFLGRKRPRIIGLTGRLFSPIVRPAKTGLLLAESISTFLAWIRDILASRMTAGQEIVGRNGMLNSRDSNHAETCRQRRRSLALAVCLALAATTIGCTQTAMRLQSPEALEEAVAEVDLVRDMTVPFGVHPLRIDAVGLVTGLAGTGSDPPLGPGRASMSEEINRRKVPNADQFLSSPNTSLVKVRGFLPPGTQEGDPIDVEVFVPRDSKTTSLAGGVLLEARMREYVRLGGRYREGHVSALAKGLVLVDPIPDEENNPDAQLRGRVLGGAFATKSRPLGLSIRENHKDVRTSRRIGEAINRRFYMKSHGRTVGVANPKTDEYIELKIHPRYKDNIRRYFQVVRSVAISETDRQRHARIRLLSRQLLDSITSSAAALRLEALGDDGVETLKTGLTSSNAEVRFYSAEALAYLDDPAAAETLSNVAQDEPAFRAAALDALSVMDSPEALDALATLLHSPSAEARYGAFRALWKINPRHPLVRGEGLGKSLTMHLVPSDAPALVHVTRSRRPEVVIFGTNVSFVTPMVLDAGRNIMINGGEDGRIRLTRFGTSQDDQQIEVPNRVEDVIRGIVQLGGTYPDVVDALSQAKTSRSLDCRFKVDALPQQGRPYVRRAHLANAIETNQDSEATDGRRHRPLPWPGEDGSESRSGN